MASKQINDFTISGKAIFVGMPIHIPTKFDTNLQKRTLVLEVWAKDEVSGKTYRQEVMFEFVNENMTTLNNIREGDWVNVSFYLRGRKHIQDDGKARWYNTLVGVACAKEE